MLKQRSKQFLYASGHEISNTIVALVLVTNESMKWLSDCLIQYTDWNW